MGKLQEIRDALAAATPGPWKWGGDKWGDPIVYSPSLRGFHNNGGEIAEIETCRAEDDAHLIANAPKWLQWQNEQIEHARRCAEEAWRKEDELVEVIENLQHRLKQAIGALEEITNKEVFGFEDDFQALTCLQATAFEESREVARSALSLIREIGKESNEL